jgi:polysaccharide biosynthesis protein PslH
VRRSILIVAPYVPLPANFGGALRIFNLIRYLAEDHEVCLLAPGSKRDIEQAFTLGDICDVTLVPAPSTPRQPASRSKRLSQARSLANGTSFLETTYRSPQLQAALDRILMTRRIDLIQFEFPESALIDAPASVPTVFDAHNVEHDLLARIAHGSNSTGKHVFNLLESRKLKRLEHKIWNRATLCLATSDRDARLIRSMTETRVEVVPNGVDLDYFAAPQVQANARHAVVFTGAMRHQPNAEGATWYARQVHPLVKTSFPDATFTIAGADPPANVQALASCSITVTGAVDDIRPWLAAAEVVAVPLWSGGGTRLKILEAFATGKPVVSTSIGAEGLDAQHGEHLLIADTPGEFAAAVGRLFNNRELSARLATAARGLVEERYGWDAIVQRLVTVHDRAINLHSG